MVEFHESSELGGFLLALTSRYLVAQKNTPLVFDKIIAGSVPDKFTLAHLQGLGFTSSNDRGYLSLLKALGFLSEDGTPTQRYKDYRDRSRSKIVMADALREAYADLFLINENDLSKKDKDAILGKFKSTHGSNDGIAALQTATFLSLLELADLSAGRHPAPAHYEAPKVEKDEAEKIEKPATKTHKVDLRYTIQIHLPPSKDMEVYNAIFKSLKENLLDD